MRTPKTPRRCLMLAILLIVVAIGCPPRPALSFSSFVTAGDWHQRITAAALSQLSKSCQFNGKAVPVIIDNNRDQDWREMTLDAKRLVFLPSTSGPNCGTTSPCPYRPEHHFDRFQAFTENAMANQFAFEGCAGLPSCGGGLGYVIAKRGRIRQMLTSDPPMTMAALIALGRALHAIQDVFSHSNYVDLFYAGGGGDRQVVSALLGNSLTGPPNSLQITRYDYRCTVDPESGTGPTPCPNNPDPYSHFEFAKDWATKNLESESTIYGPSKFDAAESAAVSTSVLFIQAVINDSPNFCSLVSQFDPGDLNQNTSDPDDPDEPGKYPSSGSNNPPPTFTFQGTAVGALDPNEKSGSVGTGPSQYISGQTPLRYAVYFANKAAALLPAQTVVITDQLDLTKDDLLSFRLGQIQFLGNLLEPPARLTSFTGTVDLRPATNLVVAVSAQLNTSSGLLTWTFRSLDPSTGQPPTDSTVGFLPPGGEGSVFFTVEPKQGLVTNTQINNQATIIFDANPPMLTAVWLNAIDNTAPKSQVTALPTTESTAGFNLHWSGTDQGSGIRGYTIYVSDNGGPFVAFQANTAATSASFSGLANHSYAFYSIAQDLVGNIEAAKTAAEATTKIAPFSVAAVPITLTIAAPGGTANAIVTIPPNPGFSGTVDLTCSVSYNGQGTANDPPTCQLGSSQLSITAPASGGTKLTVSTTAAQQATTSPDRRGVWECSLGSLGFGLVLPLAGVFRRRVRVRAVLFMMIVLVSLAFAPACGGDGGSGVGGGAPGTTVGNYTITITAAGGGYSTNVSVRLAVQ